MRAEGLTQWDAVSDTEVTGPALPVWHLAAGATLAVAAFAMVVGWQTTERVETAPVADSGSTTNPVAAGSIHPAVEKNAAPDQEIGILQDGRAIFPPASTQKSFSIAAQPKRPGTDKPAETLALWAEHTYPYLAQDGSERRAMFSWMVAGTRIGMSRSAALALGIDTVIAGRENARGVCWPAEAPADRPLPKGALGIHCER